VSLSRMAKECRGCKYKNTCKNKRIEALATLNQNTMPTMTINSMATTLQPHGYRDIKINENTTVTIDFEGIKKRCFRINSSEVYK